MGVGSPAVALLLSIVVALPPLPPHAATAQLKINPSAILRTVIFISCSSGTGSSRYLNIAVCRKYGETVQFRRFVK
jgi:hypothetical protein